MRVCIFILCMCALLTFGSINVYSQITCFDTNCQVYSGIDSLGQSEVIVYHENMIAVADYQSLVVYFDGSPLIRCDIRGGWQRSNANTYYYIDDTVTLVFDTVSRWLFIDNKMCRMQLYCETPKRVMIKI